MYAPQIDIGRHFGGRVDLRKRSKGRSSQGFYKTSSSCVGRDGVRRQRKYDISRSFYRHDYYLTIYYRGLDSKPFQLINGKSYIESFGEIFDFFESVLKFRHENEKTILVRGNYTQVWAFTNSVWRLEKIWNDIFFVGGFVGEFDIQLEFISKR